CGIERTEPLELGEVSDRGVGLADPDPQPDTRLPCPSEVRIKAKCTIDVELASVKFVNDIGEGLASPGQHVRVVLAERNGLAGKPRRFANLVFAIGHPARCLPTGITLGAHRVRGCESWVNLNGFGEQS